MKKIFRDFAHNLWHNTGMPPKQRWVWEAYFVIVFIFAVRKAYYLFAPDTRSFLYYFILRSFNPVFYLAYIAHVLHVLLTVIHCLPLFLYIRSIRFLSPAVWRHLFILRCIFEITGHSYEMNTFVAFYYAQPKLVLLASAIAIMPHIPSYLACYWYAFKFSRKS